MYWKYRAEQGASRRIKLSPYINALGLGKIPSLLSLYRLWESDKFRAFTPCRSSGTWKNSGRSLEAILEGHET